MSSKRDAAKCRREMRKRARKKRLERDQEVTGRYGESAHRSCGRKTRYPTEADALMSASRYTLLGAPRLRAYHCRYCDGWHLTKTELRERPEMGDGNGMREGKEYRVHQNTRRMAAIDARLGMDVADIAANLGITTDVVERSVLEFAGVSDDELGVGQGPVGYSDDEGCVDDRDARPLAGTYWLVMCASGKPVALCATKREARALASAINRALWEMGHDEACTVEGVEAWGTA